MQLPVSMLYTLLVSQMRLHSPMIRFVGSKEKCLRVVFDIGGGTLTVTLLELLDHISKVLATAGDDHLGGEDFDHRLTNFLAEVCVKHNYTKLDDLTSDTKAMARLKLAAERAKRILSSSRETVIEFESLQGNIDFHTTVRRSQFEECCQDLFQKIPSVLDELFSEVSSHESAAKVQEIILGSRKYNRLSRSMLMAKLSTDRSINPDEAATFGASIQAANFAEGIQFRMVWEKLFSRRSFPDN